jgi:putative inorganic carbon (HCO3(-)) transporter
VSAELLARLGGPVAAGGLGILLLTSPRLARLSGLALCCAGMALMLPLLAPSGHAALLAAGAIAGVVLAVMLAVVFRRWPWATGLLALAAVPARLPVSVGDASANLLVPLYVVLAGAVLALAWGLWRDPARRRELGLLSWPLAVFVAWVGLSALWTKDPTEGAIELFFFVFPFTLLAVVVARLPWSERWLSWLFRLLLAMAVLFAAIGVWQWFTREVFWNPKVIAGNAYAPFYRVNSVFWDPSMYGRFLVVAILSTLVMLLFGLRRRLDVPLVVLILALWAALILSFSQSSFAALVAGVAVAGALAWRRQPAAVAALAAAVVLPLGIAAPVLHRSPETVVAASAGGLNRATRGRFDLIWNGLKIAAQHPIAGVGIGGFERAYLERGRPPRGLENPASHNTPVTVAAENGVVGLGLFAWLLAAVALVAYGRTWSGPPAVRIAGLVAGVGLTAVFVHSLFYNAFFEDPMVWGFFALTALAAARARGPSS